MEKAPKYIQNKLTGTYAELVKNVRKGEVLVLWRGKPVTWYSFTRVPAGTIRPGDLNTHSGRLRRYKKEQ